MIERLLTHLFGNKIQIVTGTTLRSFHKFERVFIFHKDIKESTIKSNLWKNHYTAEKIETKRSKTIISPKSNMWRYNEEKCIASYDD